MSKKMSSVELLLIHMEAMFVQGSGGRMLYINEPWDQSKPAPRLYLGWTEDGDWSHLIGHDVDCALSTRITDCLSGMRGPNHDPVESIPELLGLLHTSAYTTEICYSIPETLQPVGEAALVSEQNILSFVLGEYSWLQDEIASAQPCAVVVSGNQVVSFCRSVRISRFAHEAGIETLAAFRGQALASKVLALWAHAVRQLGCVPLYSVSWENTPSQCVARKSGLFQFARGISIL